MQCLEFNLKYSALTIKEVVLFSNKKNETIKTDEPNE